MLYLYLDLFCFAFFVTKKNKMVYMLKSVLLLSDYMYREKGKKNPKKKPISIISDWIKLYVNWYIF